jgi:tetratricopeptide (TPR) repeat protein
MMSGGRSFPPPPGGTSMAAEDLETVCKQAREAIERRDWARAKQEYLKALGLKSDTPDVHYGLATVFFQLNELTSAAHHFKEVTRLDPKRPGAYVNLGAVLNLLTQYDDAITALRKGIALDPKRTEGYYNLGLVHKKKGQLDLAIQAYREAIRLNPRLGDAHLNLANVYLDKRQYRQAISHYEHALQVRPGWSKALDGMALAQAALAAGPDATESRIVQTEAGQGERLVDPTVHGDYLNELHHVSVESEEVGRHLQTVLSAELETALKELSLSLLATHGASGELADRVSKFEDSVGHVVASQKALKESLVKLQELEKRFADLPPGTLPEPKDD